MSAALASWVHPSRRKPLAACVAALFGLSSAPAVHAGTVFVTNCSNEVVLGSLPWAATQAVNGGDIIDMTGISDFSACFHNKDGFAQAIVLASAVTVATGVTIKGPNTSGSKVLAVSTNTFDRVFYSAGSLTINNLGIKYGTATTTNGSIGGSAVYGGCVFARGGMNLNGVVLDHCTANATGLLTSARGGSIAAYGGPVVLTNVTIAHSAATSSGSGGGGALGGALFAHNGDVTLTGSQVSGTVAAQSGNAIGGGIAALAYFQAMSLTNSEVRYSYANGFGAAGWSAQGGGIFSHGRVTLANSTVRGGFAYQYSAQAPGGPAAGGCIFATQGVYLSDNSYVINCFAGTASNGTVRGGGIYSGAAASLRNSIVEFTQASSVSGHASGGGIFSKGLTTSAFSSIYQAFATSSSSKGGAIFSLGGVDFFYGSIAANAAQYAGGILVASGNLHLVGAALYNNYAEIEGGALVVNTGGGTSNTATIVNSTISGNTVGASGEDAVYIAAHSTKFYNSTIAYNTGGTAAGTLLTGVAGSTAGLYSTLMSSNSLSDGTQNDFAKSTNVTFTAGGSNNLIRHPGGLVPTGTLTGAGACPHLHKLAYNGGPTPTHRLGGVIHPAGKNPAIDTGSNPYLLTTDQRGGTFLATTPARVSGSAADIGAYEVQQDDIVFDTDFETCPN